MCDGLFCSALTTERVRIATPASRAQDEAASAEDEGAGGQGDSAPVPRIRASPRAAAGPGDDSAAAALCSRATDQLHQPDCRQVSHGEPDLGVSVILGPCFNETDSVSRPTCLDGLEAALS